MRILVFMMLCISLHAQQDRLLLHPEEWRIQGDSIAVSGENHGQTIRMYVQKKDQPILVIDNINPDALTGNVDIVLDIATKDEEGNAHMNKYILHWDDKGLIIQENKVIILYSHDLWSFMYWNLANDMYLDGWIIGDLEVQFFELYLHRFQLNTSKILTQD